MIDRTFTAPRFLRALSILVFAIGFASPPEARAQGLTLTSSIGGVSYTAQRQGSIVYAGEGAHFVALNISTPASPSLLARLRLGDMVRTIRLSGTLAYVAAGSAGLYIIDIANPAAPAIVSQLNTSGTSFGLALTAGRAYLADGEAGLHIVDVSNPAAPAILGTCNTAGRAFGVAIRGNGVAYVADEVPGIQVVRITIEDNPIVLRTLAVPGRAFDVIVSGNVAYAAIGAGGLQVLNAATAATPTLGLQIDTPGSAFRIAQNGTRLFIADNDGGLQMFNLADPLTPSLTGSHASDDSAYDISTDGTTAVIADLRAGVRLANVANPASPTTLGSYETATDTHEVASNGSIAAVADGTRGVKVIDVSAPAFPSYRSRIATTGVVQDVEISGSIAYAAAGADGFLIIDISNPSAPNLLATYPMPASGVAISGTIAFVTRDSDVTGEIIALDVSAPASPIFMDNFAQSDDGRYEDVAVRGQILDIAATSDGIQTVGFAAGAFTSLGRFDTTGEARDVHIEGSTLYLADFSAGLRIFNALGFLPSAQGSFNTAGLAHGVASMGGVGFIADGAAGLQLMNVNSPNFPSLVDTYDTPGTAVGVSVAGQYAFLADLSGGVAIYSGGLPPVPPIIGFPGDVIIGDAEASTASAMFANTFVYPDAFDLSAIVSDNTADDSEIKWSFTGGGGKILINGVGPLDPGLSGIGQDDPTAPRAANRIDLNDDDPESVDALPLTVSFRNADLSPIGGPNTDPVTPGILPAETRAITLFASDCTTFSALNIIVYTANNTSDSLSGTGFIPVAGNDFTNEGDVGGSWIGGVAAGIGSTSVNANGLCMTVPFLGDNIVLWVSPERYVDLIDTTLYRVRVTAATNQSAPDAIPLWDINYDNFNSSGLGNNYGGTAWFLDVHGGAQGIGRPQGRASFDAFVTPNAVLLPQWRGTVDTANSAFTPAADPTNDLRLILRTLDVGSAPVLSNADTGTICIGSVRVDAVSLDSLVVDTLLYDTPISSSTHFPETLGQIGMGGSATINDATNSAHYILIDSFDRKTLGPNDLAQPNLQVRLYPVIWEGDALYRGRLTVRSDVDLDGLGAGQGFSEGNNDVDAITLLFDTTNSELGQFNWTTRGTALSMGRAASPRLPATVASQPQIYTGFFYGQNATSSVVPFANRLRMMGDFANSLELYGFSGTDPFAVTGLAVEKLVSP
jgi:hypothetical protein